MVAANPIEQKSLVETSFEGLGALAWLGRRGEVLSAECPSRGVLKHITSQWGVLVLVALRGETRRFSELRRLIHGVSEKMLAQTLQDLEGDGFVLRFAYPVVPPRVEYSLTHLGDEVTTHVCGLVEWIESNLPRVLGAREAFEDRERVE